VSRSLRVAMTLVCALALVAPRAGAASAAPLAESLEGAAKRAYDAAKLLFSDKDFAGASIKFREAFDESRDPRLLWNIAASEKNLRHYEKAVGFIRRYLAEASPLVTEEQRTSATQALEALEGFLGEVTVTVDPEDARVLVDGEERAERGASRVLRVDQGKRAIRAERDGFTPFEAALEVVGGKHFELPLVLTPLPKPAPKPELARVVEPVPPETPPKDPLAASAVAPQPDRGGAFTILDVHWGWWAAGAAVLTTAVTVTALALSSSDSTAPPIVPGTLGSVRLPLGGW
jgi:hypothetical protein